MPKFILSIVLGMVGGILAVSAQNSPTHIISNRSNRNMFSFIPAYFSGNNKTTLYSYTFDSTTGEGVFDVYDNKLSVKESFSISMPKAEYKLSYGSASSYVQPSFYVDHAIDTGMEAAYYLCKNIFSNSGEYEVLLPVLGSETVSIPFGGGYQVEMYTPIIGFDIISQSRKTLRSVRFPKGYYGSNYNMLTVTSYILDGNIMTTVPVVDTNGNSFVLVYDLGSTMASVQSNTIQPKLLRVTPSLPSKGETITITYPDDTNSDKNYKIFSASGQLVYSQISQSNSISVPSSSLPPGMNIVYVSIHGETFEASKIIVR